MIAFWMMTGLAAALAALLVMTGARRGADPATGAEGAAGVREIEELERLKARGLLDDAAYVAARAEAGRRLLAQQTAAAPVAGARDRWWVLGGVGLTVALALGLYVVTGTPGLPDQGYERRVDDWSRRLDTLAPPQLAAVAARVVRDRPDDKQALAMLGAARFAADDPLGAASAFRRLIDQDPKDAQAWARLGESLMRANDGKIGGDAEAAFIQAVRLDPDQLGARFFLGQAALERGDDVTTRRMWTPLIAALDPTDPRRLDLERRMPSGGVGGEAR